MYTITTMGDLDISPEHVSVSEVFKGAQNRTQIAAFLGALAWEKFSKGVALGLVAGVVGTVAISLYLKKGV